MVFNAVAKNLNHQSRNDFKDHQFEASLIPRQSTGIYAIL